MDQDDPSDGPRWIVTQAIWLKLLPRYYLGDGSGRSVNSVGLFQWTPPPVTREQGRATSASGQLKTEENPYQIGALGSEMNCDPHCSILFQMVLEVTLKEKQEEQQE